MEDGVPLRPPPMQHPPYYFPMTSRMTGVEIFKGAAGTQFGPFTVGGAINMLSREAGEQSESAFDIALGSRLTTKAHAWTTIVREKWDLVAEGMTLHNGGFKTLESGGFTGFDHSEFMLKTSALVHSSAQSEHRLRLKLGYAYENSKETYLGLALNDYAEDPMSDIPPVRLRSCDGIARKPNSLGQ